MDYVSDLLTLEGKVCIVTGAAGGIGRKIAEIFSAAQGIVYAIDIQKDKLEEWTQQWNIEHGNKIICHAIDICSSTEIKAFISKVKKEQQHIDVLVNNAAIISYELLSMVSINSMKKMFDVNVFGLTEMMQYTSRIMLKQNSGSIINIASMVGVNGVSGQMSYSGSKGAVVALTKSAAKELAKNKIRVNAVAPGMVATERFNKVLNSKFSDKTNDIPFGRLAEDKEIAYLCLFLASGMSEYITGQVIGIDGGIIL